MKTIIQIWNPRYSRFCMCDFLNELSEASSYDYEPTFTFKSMSNLEVCTGDIIYIYFKGFCQSGIVLKGEVIKGKYDKKNSDEVRIRPYIMFDPSAIPLLQVEGLPDTNQAILLTATEADLLDTKWEEYMAVHKQEFEEYRRSDEYRGCDKLFINDEVRAYLYYVSGDDYAKVKFSKRGGLKIEYVKGLHRDEINTRGISWRNSLKFFSVKTNQELVDLLVNRFKGIQGVKTLIDYLVEKELSFSIDTFDLVDY